MVKRKSIVNCDKCKAWSEEQDEHFRRIKILQNHIYQHIEDDHV